MVTTLHDRYTFAGLALSQMLAVTCNIFLDIQYGSFAFEVTVWSIMMITTLLVGYWLNKQPLELAQKWLKAGIAIAVLATLIFFMPIWGIPRALGYVLAALMCAYNFNLRTPREAGFSLLMTLILVIFAATHYRADWVMLFYMLPYLACATFTIISLQASQVMAQTLESGLIKPARHGQLWAISAATTAILLLGFLLYLVTPQLTEPYFYSHWGNPASLGSKGISGNSGGANGDLDQSAQSHSGQGGSGQSSPGQELGQASEEDGDLAGTHYKTGLDRLLDMLTNSKEMRAAANRNGMPVWQKGAIRELTDISQLAEKVLKPMKETLGQTFQKIKEWIKLHPNETLFLLLWLMLILLLIGIYFLLREAKAGLWLITRYDYWTIKTNPSTSREAYYKALLRLYALNELPKSKHETTQEYLTKIGRSYPNTYADSKQIIRAYEDFRFGKPTSDSRKQTALDTAYFALFQHLRDA